MTDREWSFVREDAIAAARRQGYRAGVARGLIAGFTAARTAVADLLTDPLPVDELVEQYYTVDMEDAARAGVNEALNRGAARLHRKIMDQTDDMQVEDT